MKILAMVTMAATATASAGEIGAALERKVAVYMDPNAYGMEIRAAQRLTPKTTGQKITVYLQNEASVPSPMLSRARTLASEMFAGVGVQIDWRAGVGYGSSRCSWKLVRWLIYRRLNHRRLTLRRLVESLIIVEEPWPRCLSTMLKSESRTPRFCQSFSRCSSVAIFDAHRTNNGNCAAGGAAWSTRP
jgi:hypothetical protein